MAKTGDNSKKALIGALNGALADHLALYVKTKSFHWHVAGPRFRDLHLLFDEQAQQILSVVDLIAERVRKNDADTLTSIGAIGKTAQIADEDSTTLDPEKMVEQLRDDNAKLVARLKEVKEAAEEAGDNATSGVVDEWTDFAEERVWFLRQVLR
ncbi:DNA starvation/stationary phase protection protein [Altererythrobacter soli]|uniref:DNA starvation/stationary phase protection protein n=1 Tax=Croceibacterium soli TaxID=1739690 RepID=A0A6I4UTL9_9SPHN|nr:DNA starvation/stationary phase protection protein [Croceibacterium soli]MXP41998.1 DNA starvation/stationary phase protection protein [Croceibacterium soli]